MTGWRTFGLAYISTRAGIPPFSSWDSTQASQSGVDKSFAPSLPQLQTRAESLTSPKAHDECLLELSAKYLSSYRDLQKYSLDTSELEISSETNDRHFWHLFSREISETWLMSWRNAWDKRSRLWFVYGVAPLVATQKVNVNFDTIMPSLDVFDDIKFL